MGEGEGELTNLRNPSSSEIFHKSGLINKILGEFIQSNKRIHSIPNAVCYLSQAFKNFSLNFHITTFFNNIPQP